MLKSACNVHCIFCFIFHVSNLAVRNYSSWRGVFSVFRLRTVFYATMKLIIRVTCITGNYYLTFYFPACYLEPCASKWQIFVYCMLRRNFYDLRGCTTTTWLIVIIASCSKKTTPTQAQKAPKETPIDAASIFSNNSL